MLESWIPITAEIELFRRFLSPDFPALKIEHALDKHWRINYCRNF